MPRQMIINEINAPVSRTWTLLADPKEFAFWAPNVRDLTLEPNELKEDTIRHFRLDVQGKIETLDTRVTHFEDGTMFAETPVGGSLGIHNKVEKLRMIYRVEEVDAKNSNLTFTIDYEMKGFMNKLLEKVIMGTFISQLRLWLERMKTYAETGRPV